MLSLYGVGVKGKQRDVVPLFEAPALDIAWAVKGQHLILLDSRAERFIRTANILLAQPVTTITTSITYKIIGLVACNWSNLLVYI